MWVVYYGHLLNMDRREIMTTRYGDMLDLISLHSVYNGVAVEKRDRLMSVDDALALR